ncbi:hypothetical protein NL676_037061 [Syzygium grande]|nr:hypothetical protein NL676_037061 [Syzygium grande]
MSGSRYGGWRWCWLPYEAAMKEGNDRLPSMAPPSRRATLTAAMRASSLFNDLPRFALPKPATMSHHHPHSLRFPSSPCRIRSGAGSSSSSSATIGEGENPEPSASLQP